MKQMDGMEVVLVGFILIRIDGLLRAYEGSIFSYCGDGIWKARLGTPTEEAIYYKYHPTRAVIVVGNGI